MPDNASSNSCDNEPAVTSGFLGLGKIISSNTTGGSDYHDLGDSATNGTLIK